MAFESILSMEGARIKFGFGATRELATDLQSLGLNRVLIITDPLVASLEQVIETRNLLKKTNIDFEIFSETRIEPSDASFQKAIQVAINGNFDGFVAIGGGSSIDTAKAANLYSTYPADFLTYVNHPIGMGKPIPGPLKPLIAVPTTAGTGSETTGVAIFDYMEKHTKTGIAHRELKPTLGIVDPSNTETLPPLVIASTGLDVLSHALESYTALSFISREAPDKPELRPAYQGSNPISDIWAKKAIELVKDNLVRTYNDPTDEEARKNMMLAATFAGYGFGNAGVHLPHGMSYPVSSMISSGEIKSTQYESQDSPSKHPIVPHGISVIINSPAVFRFTAPSTPKRHLEAASFLEPRLIQEDPQNSGNLLANSIIGIMQKLNVPSGLSVLGFHPKDIPLLVKGTLPQHRVTKLSPRPATKTDLTNLFNEALNYW